MLILIGNSPSSGSTFLAEILDSLDGCFCGPELSVFANPLIFDDYSKYKSNSNKSGTPLSIYKQTNRPYYHNLPYYGLSKREYFYFCKKQSDAKSFTQSLIKKVERKYHKNVDLFFEKSPENIASIRNFLHHYSDGYYIHIVRNPIYVYKSLIKRGFSPNIALLTWYFDVIQALPFAKNNRLITVKYEDLSENPSEVIMDIFETIGKPKNITNEELEKRLANNKKRKGLKRIESWSGKYGNIYNANDKPITEQEASFFSKGLNYGLTKELCCRFNIPEISYKELIHIMGYSHHLRNILNFDTNGNLSFTFREKWLFHLKGIKGYLKGSLQSKEVNLFTNPIKKY